MNKYEILEAAFYAILAKDGAPNGTFDLTPEETDRWWDRIGSSECYLDWNLDYAGPAQPVLRSRV